MTQNQAISYSSHLISLMDKSERGGMSGLRQSMTIKDERIVMLENMRENSGKSNNSRISRPISTR